MQQNPKALGTSSRKLCQPTNASLYSPSCSKGYGQVDSWFCAPAAGAAAATTILACRAAMRGGIGSPLSMWAVN